MHRAALIAVSMALALAACASQESKDSSSGSSSPSSVGQYVDDAGITAKVKTALVTDVGAKAATEISVTTEKGVVQLAGFASSRDEADRAIVAAKRVDGVRDVKDDIRLK